ncbi:Riboflavin synthase eubacterial/eukaryotic [hydrothermal vent metagenome]|uniref:Riboflavin synthase n=1 Tax=hydrothermal vent metagenome TaxID=652676 RepID=A0A3B0QTC5_9ZZZZ
MFTGIVECLGTVKSIEKIGISGKIFVKTRFAPPRTDHRDNVALQVELAVGDSVAVNGVCLTVTRVSSGEFVADISDETLKQTNIGGLGSGASVNLERALTPFTPMGGHIVTGHIDCTGALAARVGKGTGEELEFTMPPEFQRFLVHKGSVAVDGISLTVAALTGNGFKVAVIPHTIENTTLQGLRPGQFVNIETDLIGKYVERFMRASKEDGSDGADKGSNISAGFLAEHGFLKGE